MNFEKHFEPLSISSNLLISTGLSLFPLFQSSQEALNVSLQVKEYSLSSTVQQLHVSALNHW